MSRKLVLTATAALAILVAAPAMAQETPVPPAGPQPASAEQRAAAERADALTRSVFWTREVEVAPGDAAAGVNLARALRELGRFERAIETADAVLLLHPGHVEAMLEVGRAHIGRGQAFYGVAVLERARATAPHDWRPLSLLGVAYEQVRRHDDARAAWAEGLVLSPDNPAILSNMAMSMAARGDALGAEPLLRRAAAQPGATLQIRQNLALVLGLTGKAAEAEQILRRDLPPDQAEGNLDWLRERAPALSGPRTWDSLTGR